jgi:hypothetical protein
MKIILATLAWAVALAGGWVIWVTSQLYHLRPGVFGAEGLVVMFALWLTWETRKCG